MAAPPAPPPSVTAMEAVMAKRDAQRDAAKRKGMASTVLAGAQQTAPATKMPGQGTQTTLGA